jgi:hypothetical protein
LSYGTRGSRKINTVLPLIRSKADFGFPRSGSAAGGHPVGTFHDDPPLMTDSRDDGSVLDSTLTRLARCSDPAARAAEDGLRVRDGRVLVDVEYDPADGSRGYDPADDDDLAVVAAFGNRVEGYVAFADLLPLAGREGVRAVRRPTDAVPQNDGGPSE